ncbi:PREDICTED: uncharacterized protein LOC109167844 [Ipomoea nil]|uniref:uncharacterized protein LOC109167844 n=1 Tax=Ipomoea nil TaxID=35883 RepID=UPI0009009985|nr:PREDICTED: uncharacterized protein LOC109167844 [Ipomoea nil]
MGTARQPRQSIGQGEGMKRRSDPVALATRFAPLDNEDDMVVVEDAQPGEAGNMGDVEGPGHAAGTNADDRASGQGIRSLTTGGDRSRRPNVVVSEKQIANTPPVSQGTKSGAVVLVARAGRENSGRSRRATEEDEHVVVRGEKGGLVISSSRVSVGDTDGDVPSPVWQPTKEHHSDPPGSFDDEGDAVMDLEVDPAQHENGGNGGQLWIWRLIQRRMRMKVTGELNEHPRLCFLLWFVCFRGAGGKPFLRALKHFLRTHRPFILGLFEPKVSGAQANAICMKLGFSDCVRVEAVGFSGGIWVFWKDPMQITVDVQNQPPGFLAPIYGRPAHHLRRRLWKDLRQSAHGIHGPCLIAGDFNTVLNREETNNYSSFSSHRSSDFANWIQDEGLIDVGFSGPNLTWVKDGTSEALKGARLDRALCNMDWRIQFPDACVTHLARLASDHAPFVSTDLHGIVERAWKPTLSAVENALHLAAELAVWNRDSFGCVFKRKWSIMAQIQGLQRAMAINYHSGMVKLDTKLREEMEDVLHRNTAFYHAAATIRKSRNVVHRLADDNSEWISKDTGIRDHIRNFFIQLFSYAGDRDPMEQMFASFPRIRTRNWACFNRQVSKEEVHKALKDMQPFKAPGPDGFQAGFYQQMWDTTDDSIFCLVKEAFATGNLPAGLNDTLIVLIPKAQDHPTKIVGPFQSSFVPGRQISDNVLIFQEVMHSMRDKRGTKGFMEIKLDLEKAYDLLSWNFIQDTLEHVGFTANLKNLMMSCIRTSRFSLIWNGERLEYFCGEWGIRQGDAMSPAIFVLCMERLSQLIDSKAKDRTWKGIQLVPNGPILTHLCFVDDMILFMEATHDQVEVVKDCLECFCKASGQRVSLGMSQVFFSKSTDQGLADEIVNRLNIERTNDLGKYLGVPALHGRDFVTSPKDVCGLGGKRLTEMNVVCMAKLGWRLKTEPNSLWAQTINTKYRILGKGLGNSPGRKNVSNVWRGIAVAWGTMEEGLTRIVRSGRETQFWMDKRLSPEPLYAKLQTPLALG